MKTVLVMLLLMRMVRYCHSLLLLFPWQGSEILTYTLQLADHAGLWVTATLIDQESRDFGCSESLDYTPASEKFPDEAPAVKHQVGQI